MKANSVFGRIIKNLKQHRDIKLVTIETRRSYLVSEPSYHTTNLLSKNLLAIKMKETIFSDLSILDINKIVIYDY